MLQERYINPPLEEPNITKMLYVSTIATRVRVCVSGESVSHRRAAIPV